MSSAVLFVTLCASGRDYKSTFCRILGEVNLARHTHTHDEVDLGFIASLCRADSGLHHPGGTFRVPDNAWIPCQHTR